MRPIDADRLKAVLEKNFGHTGGASVLEQLIDEQPTIQPVATDTNVGDTISRKAMIDALHTWFRDGFDEDKWWNSTHVLAAIEGLPSVQQERKWETCFECPLSHGCPKIKGCTNEQAIEYASQIPNDCPLSAQPNLQPTCDQLATDTNVGDTISRQAAIDAADSETVSTNPEHFKSSEKFIKFMDDDDIASFGRWQWANGFNTALVASKVQLEKLPSAQPEQRWIPCSERMPEEHEWLGTKKFGTTISDEVYVTFENEKGERFCKHLSFQNGKLSNYDQFHMDTWYKGSKPIAWMPLPKPFEGGIK